MPNYLSWIILLCAVAFSGGGQAQPQQAVNTVYKSASLGGQQVLPCGVNFPQDQNDLGFVVTWKKGSLGLDKVLLTKVDGYSPTIQLDYQDRLQVVNKASLQISHIDARDQDWYECSVLFTNGRRETPSNNTWIHLTVHAPPVIDRSSGTLLNVPKGERVRMFCEGHGTPSPTLSWTKDGLPLNSSSRVKVTGQEVEISQAKREDGGTYTCTFSNLVGETSQPIKLVVEGSPYILTQPSNQTLMEGQRVVFPCGTEGYPSTIVHTWSRDGQDIRQLDGFKAGRIALQSDGSLVIKSVVKTDRGWYTCRPSNGLGQDEASAYLNVVYKPVVLAVPSQLTWVREFRQHIDCPVDSNPPVLNIFWVKDQEQIYKRGRHDVLENGTLVVEEVVDTDAGSYRCTPENALGQGSSSNRIQVVVRDKPDPPQFTVSPLPLYVKMLGDSVVMSCQVTGIPTVTLEWSKVGGKLDMSDPRLRITDKFLEIRNLSKSDSGRYECRASNVISAVVNVTELRVINTTPHPPVNLTVSPGLFNISLAWTPGYDGGFPQYFMVWFQKASQVEWSTVPVPGPGATSFRLHHLQPDCQYQVKVQSRNSLGNGSFSETVLVRTLGFSPEAVHMLPTDQDGLPYFPEIAESLGPQPTAPLNVTALVKVKDIDLAWKPPASSPVPIFSYRVEYQHDGRWQVYHRRIVGNWSSSATLPNMAAGSYNIWLRSCGVLAYSPASNTVRVKVAHGDMDSVQNADASTSSDGVLIPQALVGGIVGGVLFLLVAILLALVAVFYSRRKERRAKEKNYSGIVYGKPQEMNGRYQTRKVNIRHNGIVGNRMEEETL